MNFLHSFLRKSCIFSIIVFTLLWALGLICGVVIAANDPSVVFLMRLTAHVQVSIVGLIYVSLLPLILCFYSSYRIQAIVFYILSTFKGLLFGYCIYGIALSYTSACWLMCLLLLFTGSLVNLCMICFAYHILDGRSRSLLSQLCSLIFVAVIGLFDYFLVSPFVVTLMNSF